jgi:hypothetical protein
VIPARPSTPRRPGRLAHILRASLLTTSAAAALALLAGAPSASPATADAGATHAYLQARLAFDRTSAANIPASRAALEAFVHGIEHGCPGVLVGAPTQALLNAGPRSAARDAQQRQLAAIELEYLLAPLAAWLQPDRRALLTMIATVRRLHWSEPRLRRLVPAAFPDLAVRLETSVPDVCGDDRAWVASGYTRITPSVSRVLSFVRSESGSSEPEASIEALLARKETAADRVLARRAGRMKHTLSRALAPALPLAEERLRSAVGLRPRQQLIVEGGGSASGTAIGTVQTAAGRTVTVSVKRGDKGCQPDVEVTESSSHGSSSSGGGGCGPRAGIQLVPPVMCNAGLLSIEARTPAGAVTARLLLSDGTQISSPVLAIPASVGGPEGFYYQVVRGPSPIPVSITELDAGGATLAVLKLAPVVECTRHPRKLLPGGRRTLGRGRLADGSPFAIVGERFSYLGRIQLVVLLQVGSSSESGPEPSAGTLSWAVASRCSQHPYTIAIGLLRNPADTVLVRTAMGLVVLRKVVIPASLHQPGDLVYARVSLPPREFIVRDARGRTVRRSSTSGGHREEACTPSPRGNQESSGISIGHTR